MNLEKIRNHQNRTRILRQKNTNQQKQLTTADLLQIAFILDDLL